MECAHEARNISRFGKPHPRTVEYKAPEKTPQNIVLAKYSARRMADRKRLVDYYEDYLNNIAGISKEKPWLAFEPGAEAETPPKYRPGGRGKVGIVGGGIAGLYAGLLLDSIGVDFTIFEASAERLGGRIYTHRFSDEPWQYFEAGAMRLPDNHTAVFDLIEYANKKLTNPADKVELIDYTLTDPNNLVYVNGKLKKDGKTMTRTDADADPDALGFPLKAEDKKTTANDMMEEAMQPFMKAFEKDPIKGIKKLMRHDDYSTRAYVTLGLEEEEKWYSRKINYVEVMTSQTNHFVTGWSEQIIESATFSASKWKTIKDGMDRLPWACKKLIDSKVKMGTLIELIEVKDDGRVTLHWKSAGKETSETFDAVILAVPPSVLHFLDRPRWSVGKEAAIRSVHLESLFKMGLQFKSRFWEKIEVPSKGGQSITDLPSRWIVYPSYGIGDSGKGILLIYNWMTDADRLLSITKEVRVKQFLDDLNEMYKPFGVDVYSEYTGVAHDVSWSQEYAMGVAMFFPGMYKNMFMEMRRPEGNIHFAGEHLTVHHGWILGSIGSACDAVSEIVKKKMGFLKP